jgi:hypothetical protein
MKNLYFKEVVNTSFFVVIYSCRDLDSCRFKPPGKGKGFSPHKSRPALGPNHPLGQWVLGFLPRDRVAVAWC